MQICIHQKDNSPKPVNHRLTLKEGPKVKSDIRRFPAHDILCVGFTFQSSGINNKRVISTLTAGTSLQKKMKPNLQPQQQKKLSRPNKKGWQGRRPQNQNKQLTMLLNGLNKLLQK